MTLQRIDDLFGKRRRTNIPPVESPSRNSEGSSSERGSNVVDNNEVLIPWVKPSRVPTIYACEDPEDLAALEVNLQKEYTGNYLISSEEAAVPDSTLRVSGMLDLLNDILATDFTIDTMGIERLGFLQDCIDRGYDFGTTYARVRKWWNSSKPFSTEDLQRLEENDRRLREAAVDSRNQIVNPHIRPRRVWDLYSNRVVPAWVAFRNQYDQPQLAAVSHSWMSEDLRHAVETPINSCEWPVPIPIDSNLERVRIELLNHGMEYAWLDVLCLRQAGKPEKEALRMEEWKLDVPTIGSLYPRVRMPQVNVTVQYFSGLGRPFHIGDLESERHWLRRAWTLQETCPGAIVGGVAEDSPIIQRPDSLDEAGRAFNGALYYAERCVNEGSSNTFMILTEMQRRVATTELDRVAGLAYLLSAQPLPAYISGEPPESAWARLIEVIASRHRGDMLFLFPLPGDGTYTWCPSWEQVQSEVFPGKSGYDSWIVQYYEGAYRFVGRRIDNCRVSGFRNPPKLHPMPGFQTGTAVFADTSGVKHDFRFITYHKYPIDDGYYTLISGEGNWHEWVLGRTDELGRIEKVSVIRMLANKPATDRMKEIGVDKWIVECVLL